MSSNKQPISIAIIGAGIAGITLAIALSERNPEIELKIFESRLRFSEISAGVGFGPNAVKAMGLISPRITEAYNKVKTTNLWPDKSHVWCDIRSGDGCNAGELITEVASERGFTHCSASRAQFLQKLVELVPKSVEVQFGKRIIDVKEDGVDEIGKTRLRFEDGSEALVIAVVGCDGIRSACRRILLGEGDESTNAVYSGKYAYRKVVSMKKAIQAVGSEVQNRQIYLGHGGHILTFPILDGKALSIVAFKDADGIPWTHRQWVIPSSRDAILKDFKTWGEKATKLLELIEDPEKWALFDVVVPSTFSKEGFCILGDAAHASTPHLDAGAGFAIEDAYLLSGLMTPDLIKTTSDIKQAFRIYGEIRRPRCLELIDRSREQGSLFDLRKQQSESEVSRDELRTKLALNQQWVWDVDLEGMLDKAKEMFVAGRDE
ncbi:6-methylsalicylic acid decarboxylase atA [Lachnellula suecica]|uniref:6-methylsalicylic acid decarboxylase atA n=1 Tax=Lachnellula suecica TaxID=602035 RepID=A0A8T9CJ23_9HELO|nr:6-methylsalicylic acid decarboxylase atA [Lachnellula suecica]